MNKKTHEVTMGNLFSDAADLIGTLASNSISLVLTLLLCVADFVQIFMIEDKIQTEGRWTILIASITIVAFLDLSMFLAGMEFKKLYCGRLSVRRKVISVLVIVAAIGLFAVVFYDTFLLKFELKEALFSLDSSGKEELVNKATRLASEAIGKVVSPNGVDEAEVIRLSAILSGSMPAFTSILSFMLTALFYDPEVNDRSKLQIRLLYNRYRAYVTKGVIASIRRQIGVLQTLPNQYDEAVKLEYTRFSRHMEALAKGEQTARIAHYTAASEVFKHDQNIVTELSKAAKGIPLRTVDEIMGSRTVSASLTLPDSLTESIRETKALFEEQIMQTDGGSAPAAADASQGLTDATTVCPSDAPETQIVSSAHSPDDGSEDPSDTSAHSPDDGSEDPSDTPDTHTPAPDMYVAPWLRTSAANQ